MRSRLEAQFAGMCDALYGSQGWAYEPGAFADQRGDYLPDFRVVNSDGTHYYEIRPHTIQHDEIHRTLSRMSIIWSSEPTALLHLELLRYGWPLSVRSFNASRTAGWSESLWTLFDRLDAYELAWTLSESRTASDLGPSGQDGFEAMYEQVLSELEAALVRRLAPLRSYVGERQPADTYGPLIWRAAVEEITTARRPPRA